MEGAISLGWRARVAKIKTYHHDHPFDFSSCWLLPGYHRCFVSSYGHLRAIFPKSGWRTHLLLQVTRASLI